MADSRQLSPTSTLHDDRDQRQHASSALEKVDLAEKGSAVPYDGAGTAESPYIVKFLDGEQANPQNWTKTKKWTITANSAISTLCIAFGSSVVSAAIPELTTVFGKDLTVLTLSVSLYVLGFALGPLLWAPFSEQWGRRPIFIITYALFAIFNIPCAVAKNVETLLVCRFLAGFFGSSPLTNSGGVISDMFSASERALAVSLYAAAPFAGPVIGPIVGGFVIMNTSWHWIFWILTIFSFVMLFSGALNPETYAPVLLRRRAAALQKETGKVYRSMYDLHPMFAAPFAVKMKAALLRPFLLLIKEPICSLFALYTSAVYGMLYCFFGAFPLVFEYARGWSPGISGLAFIPVGLGMVGAIVANVFDNKRYVRKLIAGGGVPLAPEERLPLCCVAGVVLPLGLFAFAWTTLPHVHWIASMIFSVFFGFSMVAIFLTMLTYLVDAYLLMAASALAANAVLRSLLGFAFPLFTRQMFNKMGNQWALTFLAFLALVMAPIPFIFYIYGPKIRARSTFAPQHKPAAPAAAAPPTASVNVSRTVTRTFTREEIEREEVAMMDLRQTESRREEAETLRKEGIDVDA
ncbi:Benomyl/methotrexate resistance protein [Rhodotorula sp. JG-1b]|nr:Benomyl/methotrexate resistance protein [Rhodotorula sp. JG-1b]